MITDHDGIEPQEDSAKKETGERGQTCSDGDEGEEEVGAGGEAIEAIGGGGDKALLRAQSIVKEARNLGN